MHQNLMIAVRKLDYCSTSNIQSNTNTNCICTEDFEIIEINWEISCSEISDKIKKV